MIRIAALIVGAGAVGFVAGVLIAAWVEDGEPVTRPGHDGWDFHANYFAPHWP